MMMLSMSTRVILMKQSCSLISDKAKQTCKGYLQNFPFQMIFLRSRLITFSLRLHSTKSLISTTAVDNTIYALATAPGKAGVGIIRISGQNSISALSALLPKPVEIHPKLMKKASFYDIEGNLLDKGMYVVFPKPNSFTGEDVVELHLHSSSAVVAACYESLESLHGLRLAKPGEFIERAWKNGKMDLFQVEGVADLLEAETAQQRKIALGQMGHAKLSEWGKELIEICAALEAFIDFEEDDSRIINEMKALNERIDLLVALIGKELGQKYGEVVREGLKVVICGPPNAGKSSLFNLLLKRNAAIVSPIPGTTRDVISGNIQLNGLPVTLYDTAGLHDGTEDMIEREGIRKATELIDEADVIISVTSPDTFCEDPVFITGSKSVIKVLNKCDLPESAPFSPDIKLSCTNGEGLGRLIDSIIWHYPKTSEAPVITRSRHRVHLQDCQNHMKAASQETELEFKAELLRLALKDMGRIVGEVDSELILDSLFSSFCIGK